MKLSIVIPIYNVRDYLASCIDSVLLPECEDYEIVLVNDGSTDDSGRIAAAYAARCPEKVRLITTENGGLGAARNVGLEHANGDFVFFLDSDDELPADALTKLAKTIEEALIPSAVNVCRSAASSWLLHTRTSPAVYG